MPSRTSFYDIPAEIRLMIYDYALEDTYVRFEYDLEAAINEKGPARITNIEHPPPDIYRTADEVWPMTEIEKSTNLMLAAGTCSVRHVNGKWRKGPYRAYAVGSGLVFASLVIHSETVMPWLRKTTFKLYGRYPIQALARCCPKTWLPQITEVIHSTTQLASCRLPIDGLPALSSFEAVWSECDNYVYTYTLFRGDHPFPLQPDELDLRFGILMAMQHLCMPGLVTVMCMGIGVECSGRPGAAHLVDWLRQIQALCPIPELKITLRITGQYDKFKAWASGPGPWHRVDSLRGGVEFMTFDLGKGKLFRNVQNPA